MQKATHRIEEAIDELADACAWLVDADQVLALPAPVLVDGDFTCLAQAISNWLNNAAKYTDEGGMIGPSVEKASWGGDRPGEAVVRVRMNGRGIDPPVLKNLFRPVLPGGP